MANEVASLDLNVKSDGVKQAADDLDRLSEAGASAEQSASKASAAWSSAAAQMSKAGTPAKQASQSFTQGTQALRDQQKELSALLGKIDPVVAALGRLDDMETELGKHKNLLGEDFGVYAQKIQSMRDALGGADDQLARTGNTAKQTAQALRLLPAQFTDIAVGLQAGQSPFTVLLQQGGQIKDQFGGIGPALSAVGRYALALVNPFTVATAAVAGLGAVVISSQNDFNELNKALISTGNVVGKTAGQVLNLTNELADGRNFNQASEAVLALAKNGRLTGDAFTEVARAATEMAAATGGSAAAIANELSNVKGSVTALAVEYNNQYGFMTQSTYEQIRALDEQGDKMEAVKVLSGALADEMGRRNKEMESSTRGLAAAWDSVVHSVQGAFSQIKLGLAANKDEFKLQVLQGQLDDAKKLGNPAFITALEAQVAAAQKVVEAQDKQNKALADEEQKRKQIIAADDAWRNAADNYLTKQQRKEKEIAEQRQLGVKAGKSEAEIAARLAEVEEKYAEPARKPREPAKPKAYTDDAATRMLQSLRETGAELQAQLGTQDKLTAAQAAQAKFQQLITDLKSKTQLTADQKSLLVNQDAINAQLQMNVALDDQVQTRKELLQLEQRSAQLQETMAASNDSRQEQYKRQLDAFGMGKEQLERVRSQSTIFREFQRYQAQLDKATPKDLLGSEQYKTAAAEIKTGLNEALAANEDYYDKLDKMRGDWANGAKESFADYLDSAKDVAGQTYDLFNNALKGTEDALVEFVRTGKLSFSDLADSIISDLIRIQVRQALAYAVGGADGSGGLVGLLGGIGGALGGGTSGYKGAYGFDGGGYTGDSPRMGGIDGKGGFMAILHPQETVIDHTKPSRSQGGNSMSNVFHINVSGGSERDNKQAGATIGREINRVIQRSARFS